MWVWLDSDIQLWTCVWNQFIIGGFTGKNSSFLFSSQAFLPWVTLHNVCDMVWTTHFAAFKISSFLFAIFSACENFPVQPTEQGLRFPHLFLCGLYFRNEPKTVASGVRRRRKWSIWRLGQQAFGIFCTILEDRFYH